MVKSVADLPRCELTSKWPTIIIVSYSYVVVVVVKSVALSLRGKRGRDKAMDFTLRNLRNIINEYGTHLRDHSSTAAITMT